MTNMMNRPALTGVVSLMAVLLLSASAYPASQNRLIAKKFKWQVTHTEHFDVYYYQGAEKLLPSVIKTLEKSYDRVTQSLGITVPGRTPFFLYLNHNDFEQTNIVRVGEGTGGVTEAFKNRFLIFNSGTQTWLDHVIVHEFTHVAQFNVLYSGFWKSIRLLKSVLYPLWFMEGMAEYYSGDIDAAKRDMVLRDAITSGKFIRLPMLHGFNHVKPHQVTLAYKIGNATIRYIAREYGEDKIGILLDDIATKFDMNTALQEVLGLNLAQLDAKLRESLEEEYEEVTENLKEPDAYGKRLTHPDDLYPVFNSNPAFFPGGNEFVFLSDKNGFTEVFRHDLDLSRNLSLKIQKRFPQKVENIHREGSALDVSRDGRLILFAGEKNQKDYLYVYDVKRDKLARIKIALDSVYSPQFSPDGKDILFVGMKDGITDIYMVRRNGKKLRQITDTFEDENHVRFFPDGDMILFSRESETASDSGEYLRKLWKRSLASGEETLLTSKPGSQAAVSPSGDEVLFVSRKDNIPNIFKVPASGGDAVHLTSVIGGNFHPTYFPSGDRFLFVSHRAGEQHIYESNEEVLKGMETGTVAKSPEKADSDKEKAEKEPDHEVRVSTRAGSHSSPVGKPYGFKASTDFFFPIFFYSSSDGLFLSAFWQASEMLGNHRIQAAVTYASGLNFLNYQVAYSFLRFRPQFTLGFLGDTEDNVFETRDRRRVDAQFAAMTYPLNRFDSLQFRFLTIFRREQFTDDDFITLRLTGRENIASFGFLRDVSQGRYLETTSGYRINTTYQESGPAFGSDQQYRNVFLTWHRFIPTIKEGAFAFRAFGGASFGPEKQFFRTGGSDLMRGFGRFDPDFAASRFLISNLEFRFPLIFDLDYHLWFFFPDFLFKNVYGSVFTDNGTLWNRSGEFLDDGLADVNNSVGVGLKFQTFVLQTFPIIISLDWAYSTTEGHQIFYISLGPNF